METNNNGIFANLSNQQLVEQLLITRSKTVISAESVDLFVSIAHELAKRLIALEEKHKDQAIKVTRLPSIPPNSNPFHYDLGNMGTNIVGGWMAMHQGFSGNDRDGNPHPDPNTIDLVNSRTGRRFKLHLREYNYAEHDPKPWKLLVNHVIGNPEIKEYPTQKEREFDISKFDGEISKIDPVYDLAQCYWCNHHFPKLDMRKDKYSDEENTYLICNSCFEKYKD